MKHLIIARHGHFGLDYKLSDRGRAQIVILADKLRSFTEGKKALILTSPAPRAHESAKTLIAVLGIESEVHDILWSDEEHDWSMPKALDLIKSRQMVVDTLILMTHLEYVENLPYWFGKEFLQVELRSRDIDRGEAWVVDCQKKTLTHIAQ